MPSWKSCTPLGTDTSPSLSVHMLVCVYLDRSILKLDMSQSKSTTISSHPPHAHTETLQWVSLTIRCCEIDGHGEIDLRPRRGMRGGHGRRKLNDRDQPPITTPGLITSLLFYVTAEQYLMGETALIWQLLVICRSCWLFVWFFSPWRRAEKAISLMKL